MKIDIIKIGNSKGIRLPKAILEQCGLGAKAELEVRGREIVLRAVKRRPRDGWTRAFAKATAEHGVPEERMPLGHFANEFDDSDWTWPETANDK
jgi:antitoxin MazE